MATFTPVRHVTRRFSQGFYTGAASSPQVPGLYPVAIGGHPYLIDLKLYERDTIPLIRQAADTGEEPGEQSINNAGVWKRSITEWDLGAGQEWLDDSRSSRRRFRSSKGIDPWTMRMLTLLNDTASIRSSANTNLALLKAGDGTTDYLYCADGNDLVFTADPTVTTPTFSNSAIHGADAAVSVQSITTDGAYVYAALGASKIHRTVIGATSSTANWSAQDATLVRYANGRLFAANLNVLYEVSAAGTATAIKTHGNTAFRWLDLTPSPKAVYAVGNVGDIGQVWSITVDATDGSLAEPLLAMELPHGETINSLAYYGGVMLLGTSKGLRVAQIAESDSSLTYGPVIEISGGVKALEPEGQFCWFSWTNYDSTSTGLGRVDLASFTSDLVPAYASDLMATAQGTVLSAATFGTRRYFAVSGAGLYGERLTAVASGTINLGKLRFGTDEEKVAVAASLKHEPLQGSVAVAISSDTGASTNIGTSNISQSVAPARMSIPQIKSESLELTLTLTRDSTDTTARPEVRRATLYAHVVATRTEVIECPVVMTTMVTVGGGDGQSRGQDVAAELAFLDSLMRTGQVVTYQEGDSTLTVKIDGLKRIPTKLTPGKGAFEGICVVRMVTLN